MGETKPAFKETKELLALGFFVASVAKARVADGLDPSDLVPFLESLTSPECIAALKLALEGAKDIPGEAQGADIYQSLELLGFVVSEVKKLSAPVVVPVPV